LNIYNKFFLTFFLMLTETFAMNLNILCWEGYAEKENVAEFQLFIKTKYKINLKMNVKSVSSPSEFYTQIKEKKVDIISPAHNIAKSKQWPLIFDKLVLPINIDNIPNYKDIIDPLQRPHYISVFDDIYGVAIVYGVYGLYYNSDIVDQVPTSWNIFWDPKYKNKYSISSSYAEANVYITSLAMDGKKNNLNHFNVQSFIKMRQKYIKLISNANNFWRGIDKVDNLRGMSIATGWGFSIDDLRKIGENWKLAQPKEGTTGWIDNWMIGHSLKNKPMKKLIAEEWINYTLSPKNQASYVDKIGQSPVNNKASKYLTAQQVKEFHLDDPSFFKTNIILWPTLIDRDQKAINSIPYTGKSNN